MKKTLLLLAGLSFSLVLSAALPPLSQASRENKSTDILEGVITGMEKTEVIINEGETNDVYQVEMTITAVKKGVLAPGSTVKFSFWKVNQRPRPWVGPIGQSGMLEKGSSIRAYLLNENANFSLLMPNGFDQL